MYLYLYAEAIVSIPKWHKEHTPRSAYKIPVSIVLTIAKYSTELKFLLPNMIMIVCVD